MTADSGQITIQRIRDPKTLVDSIVEWVRGELLKGNLKPGDRLPPEDSLARSLGVSRASVREALKVLSALGVIEVIRGSGTQIATNPGQKVLAPLSFGLILQRGTGRHLLQLRRVLELGCIDLVVSEATDEDVERVAASSRHFAALVQEGVSADRLAEADVAFHCTLLEATKNPLLVLVGHTVLALFQQSMQARLSREDGSKVAAEHHFRVAQALKDRDAQALRRITEETVAVWSEAF